MRALAQNFGELSIDELCAVLQKRIKEERDLVWKLFFIPEYSSIADRILFLFFFFSSIFKLRYFKKMRSVGVWFAMQLMNLGLKKLN